jgi:hypothetical protein
VKPPARPSTYDGDGKPQPQNTYSVMAVDESGNQSAPATIVVDNF